MVIMYVSNEVNSGCCFQIAAQHRIPFLETSAKTNKNVEKAFLDLAQAILEKVTNCCFTTFNQVNYWKILFFL